MTLIEKYHGLGNDYLIWDPNKNDLELNKKRVQELYMKNLGDGTDGIICGPILEDRQIGVRIFHPDGSDASDSENGLRIFLKYLRDKGYTSDPCALFHTNQGVSKVQYTEGDRGVIRVELDQASFMSDKIPVSGRIREVVDETMIFKGLFYQVTCVATGESYCVIPMDEISKDKVCKIGKLVADSPYFPNSVNTQLLKVIDRSNIQIETYEAGAGRALLTESSCCAAVNAAFKLGAADSKVTLHTSGGNLEIELLPDGKAVMTGAVNSIGTVLLSKEFRNDLCRVS